MRGSKAEVDGCVHVTAYVLVNVGQGANGTGAIAKWLQRQIRNLFLFEGAGSNPAGVARHFYVF
jgi:hypothetical protein